jgi:hypothetical protein
MRHSVVAQARIIHPETMKDSGPDPNKDHDFRAAIYAPRKGSERAASRTVSAARHRIVQRKTAQPAIRMVVAN